jgi:hypothetical protein
MSTTITGAGMSAHYNTIAATRAQRTDRMKAVADTLGLTADELKAELRSGRTLVEVAHGTQPGSREAHRVSHQGADGRP